MKFNNYCEQSFRDLNLFLIYVYFITCSYKTQINHLKKNFEIRDKSAYAKYMLNKHKLYSKQNISNNAKKTIRLYVVAMPVNSIYGKKRKKKRCT